jgi:curli production assembly/transport component CsgF
MAKLSTSIITGTIFLISLNGVAAAGELVYRPVNPSFGGDPFNSSHLLGIANANDRYKDPNEVDIEEVLNNIDFGTTGTTATGTTAIGNGVLTDGIGNGTTSSTGTSSSGAASNGSALGSGLGISVTPNADGSYTIR